MQPDRFDIYLYNVSNNRIIFIFIYEAKPEMRCPRKQPTQPEFRVHVHRDNLLSNLRVYYM